MKQNQRLSGMTPFDEEASGLNNAIGGKNIRPLGLKMQTSAKTHLYDGLR